MKMSDYNAKYNEIARVLLSDFASESRDENMVISPFSILVALAIVSDATQGATKDEITAILGEEYSYDDVRRILTRLQAKHTKDIGFRSSNEVRVCDQVSIKEDYPAKLAEFRGQLIPDNDVFVRITNTVSFDAEWRKMYSEDNISEDVFENSDGTETDIDLLYSEEKRYVEDERFEGFIKPYKASDYVFMGLLPKFKKIPLSKLIQKLDWTKLMENARPCTVHAHMPEFSIDSNLNMNAWCQNHGIVTAFKDIADFYPMSDDRIKIRSVKHKAHIEVDRKGTKASAITEIDCCPGCAWEPEPSEKYIYLTRPFAYAIMNKQSKLPVFVGVVNKIDP